MLGSQQKRAATRSMWPWPQSAVEEAGFESLLLELDFDSLELESELLDSDPPLPPLLRVP